MSLVRMTGYERGFYDQFFNPMKKLPRPDRNTLLLTSADGRRIAAKVLVEINRDVDRALCEGDRIRRQSDELHEKILRIRKRLAEKDRKKIRSPRREPCHACIWAGACYLTGRTCGAFRGYVMSFPKKDRHMVPNKQWADSFSKDKDEA